jgi:hypothetical protein
VWDPGDAAGNHSVDILTPRGGVATCSWTSTNPSYPARGTEPETSHEFEAFRRSPRQNLRRTSEELHVRARTKLPRNYTCAPGPKGWWWKIRCDFPAQATDTTTWEARIEGNPVKLVE